MRGIRGVTRVGGAWLLASTVLLAQHKATPTAAALQYVGTLKAPVRSQVFGDVQLGNGLAVRATAAGLKVYIGAKSPAHVQQVIEADVPSSLSGALGAPHVVGALPCQWSMLWSLSWDERGQRLYQTCHNDYDGVPANEATLSAGHFENGTLVPDGQWAFAKTRPDKMVEGCVVTLSDSFVAAHRALAGKRLAAGCGGYRSKVDVGPPSMGAALAAFAPPSGAGPIASVPLVGYPFTNTRLAERMHRDLDYINDFGGDSAYPRVPTKVGYTGWVDWCAQCGTWIDTPGLSGFLMIWQRGTGRIWYTNTLNATAWRYDLVIYSADDLGKVADGAPQSSIQPAVDVPFTMPGIAQPDAGGADHPRHVVTGVMFEPTSRLLFIGVKGQFSKDPAQMATAILVYRVVDPIDSRARVP
jgi:hypothetical protein